MKYLCLIYNDEKMMQSLPQSSIEGFRDEYLALTRDMKAGGQHVAGEALLPTHTATTVRVRNGKISTTDGPFAETKEQLGGFYLIDARDLNEALQLAGRIPAARTGSVEVRPIMEMPRS